MRRVQILGAAFFAVLAFSAIGVANASAHEWLTLGGAKLVKAEKSTTDGLLLLEAREIPALVGGGKIVAHCEGKFQGTVGSNEVGKLQLDLVELVEGPNGEKDEQIDCTILESTNITCKTGNLVLLKPLNLSWKTELILEGTTLYDDFETERAGATELGYAITCNGFENDCLFRLDRMKFLSNTATGAEFAFLGELVFDCLFGRSKEFGKYIVLKFLAN